MEILVYYAVAMTTSVRARSKCMHPPCDKMRDDGQQMGSIRNGTTSLLCRHHTQVYALGQDALNSGLNMTHPWDTLFRMLSKSQKAS